MPYGQLHPFSELIQFRVRRSEHFKVFDVRTILKDNAINNGGGHEGAIGFRKKKTEISDLDGFIQQIIQKTEEKIKNTSSV